MVSRAIADAKLLNAFEASDPQVFYKPYFNQTVKQLSSETKETKNVRDEKDTKED